ncbi:MAG TPA: acyltransferase family protein [Ornithinibacter sp.]|nr:acyltransferase family protein [Ornithinibacter sp.]
MSTVQVTRAPVALGSATPGGDEQPGGREAPARLRGPGGRLAGLDGLRALAIAAVLVFHLDASWLPGGFLGVDVFFVVSGFLITTLLVREKVATGRLDLPGFWARRARRLVPALLVCVPASVLLARLSEGDLLVGIGRQVLGAATFTSNWLEIAAGSDYFAATSPQLLMNLWSLAVEEQFYLLWPLAVLALLAVTRRPETRAAAALVLAVVSAALMALLLDPGSPTRVYYGTDTHVTGLMLGAALAFAYAAPHRAWTTSAWWAGHRRQVAAASLVTLLALMALADESSALTFRGGILLASVATTALVLVVVERPGRLRAVLEVPAARWLGARSYGIYLWHWPVFLVIGQDLPVAPGGTTYLLTRLWCVVVTLVVADLSYRFVETPVRRHGFAGSVRRATARLRRLGTRTARVVWSVALVLVVALVAVLLTAPDRTSTQELITANEAGLVVDARPAPSPAASTTTATEKQKAKPAAAPAVWSMPKGNEIDAVGDSMMVGAVHALRYYLPKVRVNAKSNRTWRDAPALVKARGDGLRRAVVLAFGTNAGTDEKAIRRTLAAIGPDRMVVIVTVHGRFARAKTDNEQLRTIVEGMPNVRLAEWDAALAGTSGQLQPDGIHPSLKGSHLYAKTVRQAFADLSQAHTGTPVALKDLPLP